MAKRTRKRTRKTTRRSRPRAQARRVKKAPQRRVIRRAVLRRVSRRRSVQPKRTAQSRKVTQRPPRRQAVSARHIRQAAQQLSRPAAPTQTPKPQGTLVGEIQHYYTHLSVGVLEIHGAPVQVGDKIRVKGTTTDFVQTVQSMQLDHQQVQRAEKGQSVGLKVDQHVRERDKVYRL